MSDVFLLLLLAFLLFAFLTDTHELRDLFLACRCKFGSKS